MANKMIESEEEPSRDRRLNWRRTRVESSHSTHLKTGSFPFDNGSIRIRCGWHCINKIAGHASGLTSLLSHRHSSDKCRVRFATLSPTHNLLLSPSRSDCTWLSLSLSHSSSLGLFAQRLHIVNCTINADNNNYYLNLDLKLKAQVGTYHTPWTSSSSSSYVSRNCVWVNDIGRNRALTNLLCAPKRWTSEWVRVSTTQQYWTQRHTHTHTIARILIWRMDLLCLESVSVASSSTPATKYLAFVSFVLSRLLSLAKTTKRIEEKKNVRKRRRRKKTEKSIECDSQWNSTLDWLEHCSTHTHTPNVIWGILHAFRSSRTVRLDWRRLETYE